MGRPYTTCCRGCAHGEGHDARCQQSREESDQELAFQLQRMEVLQAQRRRRRWKAVAEVFTVVWDPVWGQIEFERLRENETARARRQRVAAGLFMACPCVMVTFGFCRKEVHSGLSKTEVRRAWRRLLVSWSFLFTVLQVIGMVVPLIFYGHTRIEENFMVGPHAQALNFFGAKNAARILKRKEWWRLLTAMFLHAGWVHLIGNICVLMRTGVVLEVIWGHTRWLTIYLVSGIFSEIASCIFLPDHLGVGSSGALCGIIGAWPPFILITWNQTLPDDQKLRNAQLVLVVSAILVLIGLGFVPYTDWAAHGGGLVIGATLSMVMFADRLQTRNWSLFTFLVGMVLFVVLYTMAGFWFLKRTFPRDELLAICSPSECGL